LFPLENGPRIFARLTSSIDGRSIEQIMVDFQMTGRAV
jgi:hypothetical protein